MQNKSDLKSYLFTTQTLHIVPPTKCLHILFCFINQPCPGLNWCIIFFWHGTRLHCFSGIKHATKIERQRMSKLKNYWQRKQWVWNKLLRHLLGGAVRYFLQHFIPPHLNYCPACKPELARAAIKSISAQSKLMSIL